jgi:S-adenosylmethionine-diacylglycerol 3-amino-3-carboxypropyl transferase
MSEVYFHGLNYSLANEDTWVEYKLAPENAHSIFTVCGSGSRAIPLLAKCPEELHIVDLSEAQLKLFRLRLAAIKKLSYQDYLYFLGYEPKSALSKRLELITQLDLSEDDLKFWQSFQEQWQNAGFIYLGKWERHFMMLGKLFQKLTFKSLLPLFATQDMNEQNEIIRKHWSDSLFKIYAKIVMNEWVANKLLYKGSFAGAKDKKTMKVSAADHVSGEFSDLFKNTWVKSNYFLQLIFLNKVTFKEAFPAECDENIFNKIKNSTTQIFFYQENLLDLLKVKAHDFYSLSDTFSYMKDEDVSDFLDSLPEDIKPHTNMVIRTFMRSPSFKIGKQWDTNPELNSKLAKEDCTRMYEFRVLSKKAFSK